MENTNTIRMENYEDDYVVRFSDESEMMEFVSNNNKSMKKEEIDTSNVSMSILAAGGLLTETNRTEAKIDKEISDAAIEDTSESSSIAMVLDGTGKLISQSAYKQFAQLCGVGCPLWTKLPINEQAELLALSFKHTPKKVTAISINEKIRGFVSPRYKSISATEVFSSAHNALINAFGEENVSFLDGSYQNDGISYQCTYKCSSDKLVLYRAQLENVGFDTSRYGEDDFCFMIRVSTSEAAESAVWASVYLCCGNHSFLLGNPARVLHVGEHASIKNWEGQLSLIGSASSDFMEKVIALNSITIENMLNTYISLGREIGLGKRDLSDAADYITSFMDSDGSGTALSIYTALGEAVNNSKKNPAQIIMMQENLARLLNPKFSWEDHDLAVLS